MKNNLKLLAALICLAILINSCEKDKELNIIDPPIDPEIITLDTIAATINGNQVLEFQFDECGFDDTQRQRQTNSYGTASDYNTKSLTTRVYNRNDAFEVVNELMLSAKFTKKMDNGAINEAAIQQILDSEMNSTMSEFFGLELGLRLNGAFYTNIKSEFNADFTQHLFTYNPGFTYNVISYEVGYASDCNEDRLLKINGTFDGVLYDYELGQINDSLNINIDNLNLVLIIN